MKYFFLLLASLLISQAIAQSSNTIEIVADEIIELKAESAQLQIKILSADEQEAKMRYDDEEMDMIDSYYFDYDEEDWEYENLLEDSPKKITKEMKKRHEEREKQRELDQELRKKMIKERELERANFKPVGLSDVVAKIKGINLPFKIVKDELNMENPYSMYDLNDEFLDTFIVVTLSSNADWDRLNMELKGLPTQQEIIDVTHETPDKYYSTIIPNLTKKAKQQAEIIASSINRKLGKVIECTNVYPYTPSKAYLSKFESFNIFDKKPGNPFTTKRKELIQYIYRFELLN